MVWKLFAGILLALLVLAAVELQGVGYVVSKARALVAQMNGQTPQDIVRTGILTDGTTTLLAVGDIANCEERPGLADKLPNTMDLLGFASALDPTTARANETAALAEDWPEASILALGDTVYGKGRPVEFADCFEPVWGSLKPRILPTPGNHEYGTPGAFGYYDYFGTQAGPGRRGWYATRVPGWLILSLNSEVDASPGSPQSTWLQARLDEAGDACILAFYHKPAHSLAERDGRTDAVSLFRQLQQGGATLVLNGHNHFYERTVPLDGAGRLAPGIGTVAFTVGTGGRISEVRPKIETTEAAVFGRTGLLQLVLRNGTYSWAHIDALTRDVLDEGSRPCNPMRA